MTRLESQLGDIFRSVRWSDSGGKPSCPRCYDGADVRHGYAPRKSNPTVRVYWCGACKYEFSDLTNSVLDTVRSPLIAWAYFLLGGALDPFLTPDKNRWSAKAKIARMVQRMEACSMAPRWKAAMQQAGFTPEQLLPVLRRVWPSRINGGRR